MQFTMVGLEFQATTQRKKRKSLDTQKKTAYKCVNIEDTFVACETQVFFF